MARRNANTHKIAKGAFKAKLPGSPSQTKSHMGTTYFAKPPADGWPGGDPLKNGYKG